MRQWIEYAVENYRNKNSFGFQLAKDLKPRQIETAIEQYARIVKPEEVVALLDTTVMKSGKSGFLLTDRYLYSSNEKEDMPVELMYLKQVSIRDDNNSYCVLEYEDGRIREIYVSVFLDVADILSMIIEKREAQEAEEKAESEEDQSGLMSGTDSEDTEGSVAYRKAYAEHLSIGEVLQDARVEMGNSKDTHTKEEFIKTDMLQEEDTIEIIGIEELEDDEPEETEEPFWDTESIHSKEQAEEEEPYEKVLEKAENGDKVSMYQAAEMLYAGEDIPKNDKEALRWFRESAKLEYVPAMLKLMQFYGEGELVKKNLTLSMSWAKKAAATEVPEGRRALARAYIYGEPGVQDTDKGLKLLDDMSAQGDVAAEKMAEEIRQEIKEAKERFDAGIRNPSTASGYYEMGMYCRAGDGYYSHPKEAVQYFSKAAEKEHVHAQYQLALAYLTGEGIKKDEAECVKWLEKAAAKSHKEATELLEEIQGKQRAKREKAEFKNHLKQAEKGDAYAQSKVAELYLEGTGVKKDIQKGIEWYEKASETDEGYAARQLVKLYTEGKYIPADEERAAYWRMVGGILDEF